ncbi:MAG: hypothetical protein C0403_09300 [Desulfobacterium sp.]|nr:hypothetical protein [Desulfobacterium sp.]
MQFEPITINRQTEYLTLLQRCPEKTSDYSFINLWGWAKEYGLEWAWTDGLVWIRQTIPVVRFWAPIGPWFEIRWKDRFAECWKRGDTFHRIPEKLIQVWEKEIGQSVVVDEDRDQWDYLYNFRELLELKGNRFHKKKNLLNQFRKKYKYQFTPFTRDLIDRALAMQESWCTWRDCESSDSLSAENRVIERILDNWGELTGIYGGAILVDDSLIAYTIAENISEDTLVIHFEKGSPEYHGVYQAIHQMFLESLGPGIQWVNREQDLGDEGLRKAKMSYNPVDFLKKYKMNL